MVYLSTLEEWQKQSLLLLQARPESARVTTKYNIPNLSTARYQKEQGRTDKSDAEKGSEVPRVPRATITVKTYDPVSGTTLKFTTDRAADVGRTIAGLGSLGRQMAGLPAKAEVKEAIEEPSEQAKANSTAEAKPATQSTSGGAGKKKKKGKK